MSVGQNRFQNENTPGTLKYLTIFEAQIGGILSNLTKKWVRVSSLLSKLDISAIAASIQQRDSVYPVESLLKLYIYKRVKGISTYPKIEQDITKNCLLDLGLASVPTKQNFNRFFKLKVSKQTIALLDSIAESILAVATKKGYILDLELVKKAVKEYKNKAREERKAMQEALRIVKKLVYPQIQIKMGQNSRFTTKDLLDILVHVAQTHDFANNGCKSFKDLYENKDVPDGDTFLYHLKKLGTMQEIRQTFENITGVIFNFARKNYNLLNRRRLDIAYDIHKIPYYGNESDDFVKGSKNERGTSHFYHFLTCDIVVAGKRFTIDVVPVHPLDCMDDLLDESIKRVKQKIHIDKAFLDRGFANSKAINVLRSRNLDFVMPIQRNDRIKQWMDKAEGCKAKVVENYEVAAGSGIFANLYLVDDEEGIKRCFITNMHVPILLSHYFYRWYGKRWGIETGYRLKAQDFRPRTTSKNYVLRLFYFLFTVILYNLWVLTNICVGVRLYDKVLDEPIITAKRFAVILYKIQEEFVDPGG